MKVQLWTLLYVWVMCLRRGCCQSVSEAVTDSTLSGTSLPNMASGNMTEEIPSASDNGSSASSSGVNVVYIESVIAAGLERYGGGFILICGVPGNMLSILVLRRKALRNAPSSLYLSVMAAADMVMIAVGQGTRHWIRSLTGVDTLGKSLTFCRFWYVIVPTATMFSSWVLAGVSVERCIAICLPLKARKIISRKAAKAYMGITLACISIYYCYAFHFYEIQMVWGQQSCDIVAYDKFFVEKFRPWFEYVIGSLLPSTMIFLCNVLLIIQLVRSSRFRNRESDAQDDQTTAQIGMLLTVSFVFLLLTTPLRINFVLNIVFPTSYWNGGHRAAVNRLNWAASVFALYLNHTINFLLYFMSGSLFRREVMNMLTCAPEATPGGSSRATETSKTNTAT